VRLFAGLANGARRWAILAAALTGTLNSRNMAV